MKKSRFIGSLLLVATCLLCPIAGAQTEPNAAVAGALMEDADARFGAADYAGALELYQRADDMMHVPSTGGSVAEALARLGKLIEAREKALAVTRLPQATDEPPPFVEARLRAQQLASRLTEKIPSIVVKVYGAVPGVEVQGVSLTMDDRRLDVGVAREVNPGMHRLQAKAPGYEDAVEDREIPEPQPTKGETPAAGAPPLAAPPLGGPADDTADEATADEATADEATADEATADEATADEATADEATADEATPVGTPANEPIEIVLTLKPVRVEPPPLPPPALPPLVEPSIWSRIPTLGYVGFGAGALGIGVGTVTGILSWSKTSSIRDDRCSGGTGCEPSSRDERDSANTLANVSNVAFGVGIAGVGLGVYAVLSHPSEAAAASHEAPGLWFQLGQRRVIVRPEITAQGMLVAGQF